MPKERTTKGTFLAVSPWISRDDYPNKRDQNQSIEGRHSVVIEEDLVVVNDNLAIPSNEKQDKDTNVAFSGRKRTKSPPWNSKITSKEDFAVLFPAAAPISDTEPIRTTAEEYNTTHKEDIAPLLSPKANPHTNKTHLQRRMQGTATLAVFRETNLIAGIFVPNHNNTSDTPSHSIDPTSPTTLHHQGIKKQYPISGLQTTTYRECTRDIEWSVVHLKIYGLISNNSSSGKYDDRDPCESNNATIPKNVLSILAERTGGDAMHLSAPVEWQGSEAEFAEELENELNSEACQVDGGYERNASVKKVEFECHSLLTGYAAEKILGDIMPELVSRDANNEDVHGEEENDIFVNVGPCTIEWEEDEEVIFYDDDDFLF